jgi:hypothetical protein
MYVEAKANYKSKGIFRGGEETLEEFSKYEV